MKTKLLAICFALIANCTFGQTLNLIIGTAISNLKWDNSLTHDKIFYKNLIGLDILVGLDYLNFKYLNLSSNLGFIQKGGSGSVLTTNVQNPEEMTSTNVKTKLNFLTVNTILEAKIPIKNVVIPFIQAGPRLDYLISYKENVIILQQFDDLDQLNHFIYGIVVGAGIDFKISNFKLGLVFDYFANFNKLVDYTAYTGIRNQISDNTFTLNFQIGYKF